MLRLLSKARFCFQPPCKILANILILVVQQGTTIFALLCQVWRRPFHEHGLRFTNHSSTIVSFPMTTNIQRARLVSDPLRFPFEELREMLKAKFCASDQSRCHPVPAAPMRSKVCFPLSTNLSSASWIISWYAGCKSLYTYCRWLWSPCLFSRLSKLKVRYSSPAWNVEDISDKSRNTICNNPTLYRVTSLQLLLGPENSIVYPI